MGPYNLTKTQTDTIILTRSKIDETELGVMRSFLNKKNKKILTRIPILLVRIKNGPLLPLGLDLRRRLRQQLMTRSIHQHPLIVDALQDVLIALVWQEAMQGIEGTLLQNLVQLRVVLFTLEDVIVELGGRYEVALVEGTRNERVRVQFVRHFFQNIYV
jgi:hypothetical protein